MSCPVNTGQKVALLSHMQSCFTRIHTFGWKLPIWRMVFAQVRLRPAGRAAGGLRRGRTFVRLLDAGVPAHVGAPPPRCPRLLHVRRQPPLHRWGRGNGEPAEIQGVGGRNPGLHKHGEGGTGMGCFGAFDWMGGNRWEELNLTRYQNRRRELIRADAFDRSLPHHKPSV